MNAHQFGLFRSTAIFLIRPWPGYENVNEKDFYRLFVRSTDLTLLFSAARFRDVPVHIMLEEQVFDTRDEW